MHRSPGLGGLRALAQILFAFYLITMQNTLARRPNNGSDCVKSRLVY